MKIEFITSYFYPFTGGIENVVFHLAEGLAKRGHKVVIHTGNSFPGSKTILPEEEKYKGFLIKRYNIYPFSLFFPKLVYTDSVISLHNYSALMNDYVVRKYPNRKLIMTPYGTITYDRSQRKYPLLSIIYDFLLGKETLFSLNKIIAMTNFEEKSIVAKYPQLHAQTITIAGGIDIVRPKKLKKVLPKQFFLSVGRIASSKRFEDVISVLNKFPTFSYVLAGGDSGYLSELKHLVKENGVEERFYYVGKVTDAEKVFLMNEAAVFIMPSSAEAFSIASVEAFCYSKKIVGAKSGGIVDVFKELEGELFIAKDRESLTKSLKKVLKQTVTTALINKRKKIITKHYKWETIITQYENAFSK